MTRRDRDERGARTGLDRADPSCMGIAERVRVYGKVLRQTGDPREAVAAYCAGNWHLEQAARAVGNWPRGR